MKKIITASRNEQVVKTVEDACQSFPSFFHVEFTGDTETTIGFINYEMPEIKVLDYTTDGLDCDKIIGAIHQDSWLHYGGIIAVCADREQVKQLEGKRDDNILSVLTADDFHTHFGRLLRILHTNQQFLYSRGMQDAIGGQEKGAFVCGNDPLDLRFYTNFLVSYLYNTNRISGDDRASLQMTLMELLMNAMEHGNLNISFEEKTRWLESGGDILSLIAQKNKDPHFGSRKVRISYIIRKHSSAFRIEDDGEGFDWRSYLEKEAESGNHGRGIHLSRQCVKKLAYNAKGNQVTFAISNRVNAVNTIPGVMHAFEVLEYQNKQIVCRQDEMSNDLFFIVSGKFAVYVNNTFSTFLTPSDIFIGEMAFLLDDRRTATVVAVGTACKVIKIPKLDFLALIRKNPHYGIFLSKMLAQRLVLQAMNTYVIQQKMDEMQAAIKALIQ